MTKIKVKKLFDGAMVPCFAHEGDAGADVYAINEAVVPAGKTAVISTGIALEIPKFMEVQVRPRSGLAFKHGITVLNTPGTIDCQYRGEVAVLLYNASDRDYHVSKGDRVAQLVVSKLPECEYEEVEDISDTERGAMGFGSTGK